VVNDAIGGDPVDLVPELEGPYAVVVILVPEEAELLVEEADLAGGGGAHPEREAGADIHRRRLVGCGQELAVVVVHNNGVTHDGGGADARVPLEDGKEGLEPALLDLDVVVEEHHEAVVG
jgi:hypothetical protein